MSDERECDELRRENEMLLVALMRIERMAAGAIYSQEVIHVAALQALKASRNPALLHVRKPSPEEPDA